MEIFTCALRTTHTHTTTTGWVITKIDSINMQIHKNKNTLIT